MSAHIRNVQKRSRHPGRFHVRPALEHFTIPSRFGRRSCMVFELMREPLWIVGRHLGCRGVPFDVLPKFLLPIFHGLDFLHSECGIIHTGELYRGLPGSKALTARRSQGGQSTCWFRRQVCDRTISTETRNGSSSRKRSSWAAGVQITTRFRSFRHCRRGNSD